MKITASVVKGMTVGEILELKIQEYAKGIEQAEETLSKGYDALRQSGKDHDIPVEEVEKQADRLKEIVGAKVAELKDRLSQAKMDQEMNAVAERYGRTLEMMVYVTETETSACRTVYFNPKEFFGAAGQLLRLGIAAHISRAVDRQDQEHEQRSA